MLRLLGFLFFLLMAGPLYASHWLTIEPSAPVAGADVHATIYLGGSGTPTFCRSVVENLDGVRHDTSFDGDTIHLDIVMNPQGGICVTILPATPYTYSLGTLPTGSYSLVVSEVAPDTTFPVSDDQRTELASMVFGVAAAPMPIPVNQPLALVLLVGLMLVAGTVFRWRRRSVA